MLLPSSVGGRKCSGLSPCFCSSCYSTLPQGLMEMGGFHVNSVQLNLDHFFVSQWRMKCKINPGKPLWRAQGAHPWKRCHHSIMPCILQGTTGSPKGATLSHSNIVNNANLIGMRLGFTEQVGRGNTVCGRLHCHRETIDVSF